MKRCTRSWTTGRRIALATVIAITFSLVLPATHHAYDDDDDDEGSCCAPSPCCVPVPAPAPSGNRCPKEYLGEIAAVHHYEVWKTLNCFGGIDYSVFSSIVATGCTFGWCNYPIPAYTGATGIYTALGNDNHVQNTRFCAKAEKPLPQGRHRFLPNGFAQIPRGSDPISFKLYTIEIRHPGQAPVPHYIGVEIDENEPGSVTYEAATWTDPMTATKYRHQIDVTFGTSVVTYDVTTYKAAH